jgi:hypothetical protein
MRSFHVCPEHHPNEWRTERRIIVDDGVVRNLHPEEFDMH